MREFISTLRDIVHHRPVRRVRRELRTALPPDAMVVVVGEDHSDLLELGGWQARCFPPTEGRGNGALCYMSEIFRKVLAACLDWSTMALRRVDNYQVLAAKLGAVAPFPQLSSKVVSLDLPVCLKKRDQVRQTLFDYEIRPSIHWQEQGIVPGRFWHSHELVAGMLSLQCYQRYGIDKMQRMAQTFRREAR